MNAMSAAVQPVINSNQQLLFQVALALACGGFLVLVGGRAAWKPIVTLVASVLTYGYALLAIAAVSLAVTGEDKQ